MLSKINHSFLDLFYPLDREFLYMASFLFCSSLHANNQGGMLTIHLRTATHIQRIAATFCPKLSLSHMVPFLILFRSTCRTLTNDKLSLNFHLDPMVSQCWCLLCIGQKGRILSTREYLKDIGDQNSWNKCYPCFVVRLCLTLMISWRHLKYWVHLYVIVTFLKSPLFLLVNCRSSLLQIHRTPCHYLILRLWTQIHLFSEPPQ